MTRIRAIAADDEPIALRRLSRFLRADPEVDLVAECSDGTATLDAIRRLRPDLVLLDVLMPDLTGFDVLASLDPSDLPAVVFVTAYEKYALKAFETHAIDYLLKPCSHSRFTGALAHAKARVRERTASDSLGRLLAEWRAERAPGRLLVRSGNRMKVLRADDIVWIEAKGAKVVVQTAGGAWTTRGTLATIEHQLDARVFVRIQRSTIVNIHHVTELAPLPHGENLVVMSTGAELKTSRSRDDVLRRALAGEIQNSDAR